MKIFTYFTLLALFSTCYFDIISCKSLFPSNKFLVVKKSSISDNHLQKSKSKTQCFLSLSGGNNNDEEDDENEESDKDIQLGEQMKQNKLVSSITDMWVKTPPITQVYIGSSLMFTTLAFILNKNIWPDFLHLDWTKVLTRFQFWRPFTAFLFYGPLGLNYVLTIQFVWTYMAQLEKLSYKMPADFFIQMIFGSTTLLVLYMIFGISTKYLGHNLSTFLVYIWARVFEGSEVNVMDLFNLKAEVLPWFFCLQTFILEGEFPFADILGIVVGHLYHYLSKRKLLEAPASIKTFFSSPYFNKQYEKFKNDFE